MHGLQNLGCRMQGVSALRGNWLYLAWVLLAARSGYISTWGRQERLQG